MLAVVPPFSWVIFLMLFVIFATSLMVFLLLVRRWTTQRQWVSLAEWARQKKFKFRKNDLSELPAVLETLRPQGLEIRLHLCRENLSVLQIQTAGPAQSNQWNLLVRRRVNRSANAAGLRPASAARSVLDLFGLSQYPTFAVGHRFTVLSVTPSSARALAESASRTLLPPDLGLLLIDDWIVLDFSIRPFDPIELHRMISIAEQLSQML